MCGFAGFIGYESLNKADASEVAVRMGDKIRHRGPDDSGVWQDDADPVAFVHRRLSIIDLSSAGHQPMVSTCGRYILVFNGEIYNHMDLRKALAGQGGASIWRGHSDTETLLAGFMRWGLDGTLSRLNGMFAFALWDRVERRLFLVRDRMGEKPLYYGRCGDTFLFGSELTALRAHPAWNADIDRNALALYLRYSYVPAPLSICKGIHKLQPAHYVVIQDLGRNVGDPICYWDLSRVAETGQRQLFKADTEEAIESLDRQLRDAVKLRMASDVPLGAFLSGGYDSTAVVALMQAQSSLPISTFSIGFHEGLYNEAQHAKAVSRHLGTDHTELYVTPRDAMAVIPKLPSIYDEPFADSSQIPTYLVSQLAKSKVTVALSGDGGDELFCGYNRYVLGYRAWSSLSVLPYPMRRMLSLALHSAPKYAHVLEQMQLVLPVRLRTTNLADRLPKLAEVLPHKDGESLYKTLVSSFKAPDKLVLGAVEPESALHGHAASLSLPEFRERMMYLDQMTYLPDDILTKVDRASMAVSLEARVPLLDHKLVEFAWSLPMSYKYRYGEGKWLLRQVVYRYVPEALMNRPKMGFGVPIEYWLRGPLKEWVEEMLDESLLKRQGYFDSGKVREMLCEHMDGTRRWHHQLWTLLMFQSWLEKNK